MKGLEPRWDSNLTGMLPMNSKLVGALAETEGVSPIRHEPGEEKSGVTSKSQNNANSANCVNSAMREIL